MRDYANCARAFLVCVISAFLFESVCTSKGLSALSSRMKWFVLSLTLLWCLVEVDSQNMRSYPNVTFMGETLANHSYVDFNLVGNRTRDSIQCHTDLSTCCSSSQGPHRGDWYFPNGTRLPHSGRDVPFGEARGAQRVEIHTGIDTPQISGIYRCDIPTNAVHDVSDISVRDTVYVGMYASGGKNGVCTSTDTMCSKGFQLPYNDASTIIAKMLQEMSQYLVG